jgi:hypothetical protein
MMPGVGVGVGAPMGLLLPLPLPRRGMDHRSIDRAGEPDAAVNLGSPA